MILFSIFYFLFSLTPALAFHEPLLPCKGTECTFSHLFVFIGTVLHDLLQIAMALAVIFIIYGGFVIMTAGGSEEKVKNGRKIITSAVIGLAIAAAAWLIVIAVQNALKGFLQ